MLGVSFHFCSIDLPWSQQPFFPAVTPSWPLRLRCAACFMSVVGTAQWPTSQVLVLLILGLHICASPAANNSRDTSTSQILPSRASQSAKCPCLSFGTALALHFVYSASYLFHFSYLQLNALYRSDFPKSVCILTPSCLSHSVTFLGVFSRAVTASQVTS